MRVIDIIKDAKGPLLAFELLPPLKGHSIDTINATIEKLLSFHPAYINITNHQEEVVYIERPDGLVERRTVRKRPGTIGLAAAIQYRYGIPVVPHLICGGNTKEQLEDQLVELNFLGIHNVFALRGDPPPKERRFIPVKGGYEHTDELVRQIAAMNRGEYLDSTLREVVPTSFCIGVAGYPEKHIEAPNMEYDIQMLKRKVDAGAHYVVTQMCFINEHFFSFVEQCRKAHIEVPIIPGIKPIGRKRDIDLLPATFHVDLPSDLVLAVQKYTTEEEVRQIGLDFCVQQVAELLDAKVTGVHFYTQGRANPIVNILKQCWPNENG